jgi:spore coat polysaccharide biosynthesis protein SpsF (cytidylyltransferase family)
MKTIVIFYKNESLYSNEKAFNGKSATELSMLWAQSLGLEAFYLQSASLSSLLDDMKNLCSEKDAQNVLFAYNDLPFLNKKLSEKILDSHIKYKSEYTFADGYPYGFTPEALNAGTIAILAELAKSSQKTLGDAPL